MVRKFNKEPPETLETILKESLEVIGVEMKEDKAKLLLRLIISGIANHYFYKPDDLIEVGFLQFCKSPDKDELFRVNILRNKSVFLDNNLLHLIYFTLKNIVLSIGGEKQGVTFILWCLNIPLG
jgi:hypothetical protein